MSDDKEPKDKRAEAQAREEARLARGAIAETEKLIARLQKQLAAIDQALIDPASASKELSALNAGELAKRRAVTAAELEAAEAQWLEANESLERQVA